MFNLIDRAQLAAVQSEHTDQLFQGAYVRQGWQMFSQCSIQKLDLSAWRVSVECVPKLRLTFKQQPVCIASRAQRMRACISSCTIASVFLKP